MSYFIVASDSYYVNHVQDGYINLLNEGNPHPEYYHFSSIDSANRVALQLNESLAEDDDIFTVSPVKTITVSVHTDTFGSTDYSDWSHLTSSDNTFQAPVGYVPCSPEVIYADGHPDPVSISTVYIDGYVPF